ncbi:MAG: hypothetical protein WAK10_04960 [Methanoregula sp.]
MTIATNGRKRDMTRAAGSVEDDDSIVYGMNTKTSTAQDIPGQKSGYVCRITPGFNESRKSKKDPE